MSASACALFQGDQAAQWRSALSLPVDAYDDVRLRLRNGDVVAWAYPPYGFWGGLRHPIRAGVQDATGSVFTHVGLLGWWEDRLQVIEATHRLGVKPTALSYYLPGGYMDRPHVRASDAAILVLRPRYENAVSGTNAVAAALNFQDAPYTVRTFVDALRWKLWRTLPGAANDVVCSSVVAHALGRVGLPIVGTLGRLATPHDVVTSPHMDVVARIH